jgi:hypothetical protein
MTSRAHGVSAAWRLGKWETVERFLENPCESDFEVQIAKYLFIFLSLSIFLSLLFACFYHRLNGKRMLCYLIISKNITGHEKT